MAPVSHTRVALFARRFQGCLENGTGLFLPRRRFRPERPGGGHRPHRARERAKAARKARKWPGEEFRARSRGKRTAQP